MVLLFLAGAARAEWDNWEPPVGMHYTNAIALDLWDAMDERYTAAGATRTAQRLHAQIVSTGMEGSTAVYATVYLTNRAAFLDFVSGGVTSRPAFNAMDLRYIDHWTRVVTPDFIQHWYADTNNLWETWFDATTAAPPASCAAAVMQRASAGYVTNLTTNAWGAVTGGENYWGRGAYTNHILAELQGCTNGWAFRSLGHLPLRYYGGPPIVSVTTTDAVAGVVTLTGSNLVGQTPYAATETVAIGAACTQVWYNVTGAACTSAAPTGAVLAVRYEGPFEIYENPWTWYQFQLGTDPFDCYADTYEELTRADFTNRVRYLDALRWTLRTVSAGTNAGEWGEWRWDGYGWDDPAIATADVLSADATWPYVCIDTDGGGTNIYAVPDTYTNDAVSCAVNFAATNTARADWTYRWLITDHCEAVITNDYGVEKPAAVRFIANVDPDVYYSEWQSNTIPVNGSWTVSWDSEFYHVEGASGGFGTEVDLDAEPFVTICDVNQSGQIDLVAPYIDVRRGAGCLVSSAWTGTARPDADLYMTGYAKTPYDVLDGYEFDTSFCAGLALEHTRRIAALAGMTNQAIFADLAVSTRPYDASPAGNQKGAIALADYGCWILRWDAANGFLKVHR